MATLEQREKELLRRNALLETRTGQVMMNADAVLLEAQRSPVASPQRRAQAAPASPAVARSAAASARRFSPPRAPASPRMAEVPTPTSSDLGRDSPGQKETIISQTAWRLGFLLFN